MILSFNSSYSIFAKKCVELLIKEIMGRRGVSCMWILGATYIGESKRALRVRINEDKNKKNSESVVCEHQLEFNHEFD